MSFLVLFSFQRFSRLHFDAFRVERSSFLFLYPENEKEDNTIKYVWKWRL